MIKDVITDKDLLNSVSKSVTNFKAAEGIVDDLLDTARHLANNCAGLAANQIGFNVRIAVYLDTKGNYQPLINPKIVGRSKEIKSDFEGCLSRPGEKTIKVRRYKKIRVKQYDPETKTYVKRSYKGFTARIVQHELDHMNGKLI